MKSTLYSILFILIVSCNSENKSFVVQVNEHNDDITENHVDSFWSYNEYDNGKLHIDIINHNLKNFSIQITRENDLLNLNLNNLNIPWKTPSVEWVNNQMICISTWWSGPFANYIFIPLSDNLNKHVYINKDIEIADSITNIVVYVDTVIYESKLVLKAENLITRKIKSIEINIPTEIDYYPFYDSLTFNNSTLKVWIKEKSRNYDLKSVNSQL